MSYWVLITAYSCQAENVDTPALGSPDAVREKLSAVFPDTDWSDPTYGVSDESGFDFMLHAPEKVVESLDTFSIRLGGSCEDPFPDIQRLCKQYGWYATDEEGGEMDIETGEFVSDDEDEVHEI